MRWSNLSIDQQETAVLRRRMTPATRRGYLRGMIRGDRYLGVYHYQRQGRAHGDVHRFRLALADLDALEQAQRFIGRRLEYVEVEITGATSQTLTGHESIVSRASS